MTLWDFISIMLAGAAGGFMSAIYLNEGKIIPPQRITAAEGQKDHWSLGIWADIFLGIGAGLIATIPLEIGYPKGIYVALLAGFGGGNFIAKQAKVTAENKLEVSNKLPELNTPTVSPGQQFVDVEIETDDSPEGGQPK